MVLLFTLYLWFTLLQFTTSSKRSSSELIRAVSCGQSAPLACRQGHDEGDSRELQGEGVEGAPGAGSLHGQTGAAGGAPGSGGHCAPHEDDGEESSSSRQEQEQGGKTSTSTSLMKKKW